MVIQPQCLTAASSLFQILASFSFLKIFSEGAHHNVSILIYVLQSN